MEEITPPREIIPYPSKRDNFEDNGEMAIWIFKKLEREERSYNRSNIEFLANKINKILLNNNIEASVSAEEYEKQYIAQLDDFDDIQIEYKLKFKFRKPLMVSDRGLEELIDILVKSKNMGFYYTNDDINTQLDKLGIPMEVTWNRKLKKLDTQKLK